MLSPRTIVGVAVLRIVMSGLGAEEEEELEEELEEEDEDELEELLEEDELEEDDKLLEEELEDEEELLEEDELHPSIVVITVLLFWLSATPAFAFAMLLTVHTFG